MFRRVFQPLGVWKLLLLYWSVKLRQQTQACCLASFLSLFPRPSLLVLLITVCIDLINKKCTLRVHANSQIVFISTDTLFSLAALASGLSQYGIVPHLISLLASPNLDPEYRLSVLLTLGHCTVATGKTVQYCV